MLFLRLKKEFDSNVLKVKRVAGRLMSLKLEIEGVMLSVVIGYAPHVEYETEMICTKKG